MILGLRLHIRQKTTEFKKRATEVYKGISSAAGVPVVLFLNSVCYQSKRPTPKQKSLQNLI